MGSLSDPPATLCDGSNSVLELPTNAGAFQSASGGCGAYYPYHCDAFVAKINSTGTALVFSTYLGAQQR